MTSSLLIDEYPVRLEEPLVWTLYTGPENRIAEFPMVPADAEDILKLDKLVTIKYQGRGQKSMEMKNVVIVGEGKPSNPYQRIVRFSDTRYYWPRIAFSRNFNETISSPVSRIISPTGTPLAIQQDVDDLQFAKYSVNPKTGKPWKAIEVLKAVLEEVVGKEDVDWVVAPAVLKLPNAQIQDLYMPGPSDNGVSAMARALSLIPGANVFQDYDGRIVVDSQLPGRADDIINGLGPPLETGQVINKVNNAHDRGRKVRVWYDMEIGARFDSINLGDSAQETDPWMRNVASTVEPSTALSDGSIVGPGTVIEINEALDAYGDYLKSSQSSISPYVNSGAVGFDRGTVLDRYLQGLENTYARAGTSNLEPDRLGAVICNEIYNSLFLRYQLNPRWVHNCLAIIPKQVGIIDPETGAEADAPVYADYAVKPANKTFTRRTREDLNEFSVNNYCSVQTSWQGEAGRLATGTRSDGGTGVRRSPAKISRVTRAGILELQYRKDPLGFEAEVIPDTLLESTIPKGSYQSKVALFNQARLEDRHRVNIILTVIPAPKGRDKDGLFRHMTAIDITPEEAAKKLGLDSVGDCLGIEVAEEISGIQPAKFAYDDDPDAQEDIKAAVGVVDIGVASNYTGPFLLNTGPGPATPVNLKDLQSLAESIAASYFMERLDRFAGSKTIPLRGDIRPIGEIAAVSHIMGTSGEMITTVFCDRDANEDLDPLAMLPTSVRSKLLRTVNPTGG